MRQTLATVLLFVAGFLVSHAASAEQTAPADLVPGSGFNGPTAQPPVAAGSEAKAIARWDVVPHQTIEDKLPVGVVAFHIAGIDRVEFSLNGGPWLAVREMTLNPVTKVWEYCAGVNARSLPDGPLEIRAVVYPKTGVPRVLAGAHDESERSIVSGEHSLFLSANAGRKLPATVRYVAPAGNDTSGKGTAASPFATIARAVSEIQSEQRSADGATVYLSAGDYEYPDLSGITTSDRWLTIAAAPGIEREKVRIITSAGKGLGTKLVRLKGLTVHDTAIPPGDAGTPPRLWADGCIIESTSPATGKVFFVHSTWSGGIHVTDCTMQKVLRAAYGYTLMRNTLLTDIGGDAMRDPAGMVVNCEVRNLVNADTPLHRDLLQFYSPLPRPQFENVIIYGIKAVHEIDAQALFVSTGRLLENFAFVNYQACTSHAGQWRDCGKHILFWNMTCVRTDAAASVTTGGLLIRDFGSTRKAVQVTTISDLSMRNCVLQRLAVLSTGSSPSISNQTWADNMHYIDTHSTGSGSPGTHVTTGGTLASLFRNPLKDDFTPAPDSPLRGRERPYTVPADVFGLPWQAVDAIGAAGAGTAKREAVRPAEEKEHPTRSE